ncbi:MAG: FAD-dependent oxidoreductase [Puniceicoccaceae bacterium]|nr:MAG: FAD-dependent oxidoreductase [Puniceicoccaceae bacterium]
MKEPVVVIGAGLAGLRCALRLAEAGRPTVVLEAADRPGGRVRTDGRDGFLLDHGFQVFLTAYPEAKGVIDLPSLAAGAFLPGARVRRGGAWHDVHDPLRRPSKLPASLASPVGTLADKLRILHLRHTLLGPAPDQPTEEDDISTLDFLRDRGFTASMLEGFFRPFMGGVFLDPELRTPARIFRFVFAMFARGLAVLPARGMGEIPAQIARSLPRDTLRTSEPVEAIEADGRVRLASGECIRGRTVVIATDAGSAARLVPDLPTPGHHPTTTFYFAAPRETAAEPLLHLDGEGRGPATVIAPVSAAQGSYAPRDRSLFALSVIGPQATAPASRLLPELRSQLEAWFGPGAGPWDFLQACAIPRALPAETPGTPRPPGMLRLRTGLYACGDYMCQGSINGALRSGRLAAEAILRDFP